MIKFYLYIIIFMTFGCSTGIEPQIHKQVALKNKNIEQIYIKAQAKKQIPNNVKTKFYNFDDLLINGQYKKPQLLYIDNKQKVKFERLLKLKKDFLPKLKNTEKDPTLR